MVLASEKKTRTMEQENLASFPLDMLPDELQNKVLFHLPTDDAVRFKTVCKEWKSGVEAWAICGTPMDFMPRPQEPFYVMFNSEVDGLATYAYNSNKGNWVQLEIHISDHQERIIDDVEPLDLLPRFHETDFQISASGGLVCLMDAKNRENVYVCNPIIKNQVKVLPKAPNNALSTYCATAIATDVRSRKYVVAMVASSMVRIDDFRFTQTMLIQVYRSETGCWVELHRENLIGWQGSDVCAICDNTLYTVLQSQCHVLGGTQPCHAVVAYNLAQGKPHHQRQCLARTLALAPCALTCVRLLNLNDNLVMVGGIQKRRSMGLEGIGIWEMISDNNKWRQVARAPGHLIRRFRGAIEDAFLSSGCGDSVYVQAYTSRDVLRYEFGTGTWEFLAESDLPVVDDIESNYFGGFCFEPRLDVVP